MAHELPLSFAMAKSRGKDVTETIDDRGIASAAAPQSAGDTTAADIDRERVAQRAYERYLARGGGDGMAMEDWLAAERELRQIGTES